MGKNGEMVEKREPGPQKRDNVVSTGLAPDTFRDFEEYRADNNLTSKSEAANRLFRSGLNVEQSGGVFLPNRRIPLLASLVLIMYVNPPPSDPFNQVLGSIAILLMVVSGVLEIRHYRS